MEIKKRTLWSTLIIVVIIALLIWTILPSKQDNPGISEELAKCISENSIYYAQTGCSACKIQEELFGSSAKYLNKIDCVYEREACNQAQITATPTWIINEQKYVGVQSIEKLKEFTGCNLD